VIADLVIQRGTVVTGDGPQRAHIAITGGKIVAITSDGTIPSSREIIDANDLCVLPGLVDPHVHQRAPGNPEWEDVLPGTAAAAAGGVTTLLEMPISRPPTHSAEVLARRGGKV
jgi:dihydroorotase-like cyclic amidohydrolase